MQLVIARHAFLSVLIWFFLCPNYCASTEPDYISVSLKGVGTWKDDFFSHFNSDIHAKRFVGILNAFGLVKEHVAVLTMRKIIHLTLLSPNLKTR